MNLQEQIQEDGSVIVPVHFIYRWRGGLSREQYAVVAKVAEPIWRLACEPARTDLTGMGGRACPVQRTDEPRAVTCDFCKATDEYEEAMRAYR